MFVKKVLDKFNQEKTRLSELLKEEKRVRENIRKLEAEILQTFSDLGITSVASNEFVLYRSERSYYRITDEEKLHKFIIDTGLVNILQRRVSKGVVDELIEEYNYNPEDLGLSKESEFKVNRRKK